MISIQAPQYLQFALISDFLDLANLSTIEEATLATNWIKDRPEGLKLQNLALSTILQASLTQLSKEYDCRCSARSKQMRATGLRETMDPSRESIRNCKRFSPQIAVLRRFFFFAENAI